MKLFGRIFKGDANAILEENEQLRKKREYDKADMQDLQEKYEEVVGKYIELLEEKGKGFDRYIYYHDLYAEAYNTIKEQKKENAELRAEIRALQEKPKAKRGRKPKDMVKVKENEESKK